MFALIDCNNFFVSCERTLDKSLIGKPVTVLSNNDGCFISRSQEAKDLGIPMGAPLFKYKKIIETHNIQCLSPKFELYNYKSQQVIRTVSSLIPEYEVYSIDEIFFSLKGFERFFDIENYCQTIRQKVAVETGIPTCIGIAPTKTLAKLANKIAKKFPDMFNGVYLMDTQEKIEKALKWLPVEDLWGIGRKLAVKMHDAGVYKAHDLTQKPEMWLRKVMGIHGVRMMRELQGIPQLPLEEPSIAKQSIATTRSFIEMIAEKEQLRERIKTFSFVCAEKLRKQNSCCKRITVFIQTNRFHKTSGVYNGVLSYTFPNASSSSVTISKAADILFEALYKEGFRYKKAGVIVTDLIPDNERLINLFEKDIEQKHIPVMKAMDFLNRKYGKDKIRLASQSGKPTYERKNLPPEYEEFLKSNTLPEASFRFH